MAFPVFPASESEVEVEMVEEADTAWDYIQPAVCLEESSRLYRVSEEDNKVTCGEVFESFADVYSSMGSRYS